MHAPTIDLLAAAREKPVHFMGLGGAGMAPLAELVRRSGGMVTGCDANPSATLEVFVGSGVDARVGHDPEHVVGTAALVVTAAVSPGHPEIAAARDAGIPVVKRAEALASIVNRGVVIGVSGTHGKTTTTALTVSVLEAAGLDPTGLVGGRVPAWNGNLRPGNSELYVVEADEFDRSFLALQPTVAILTTLEADHLDIFGSLAGVEAAFQAFLEKVPPDGLIIACGDESGVGRLLPRLGQPRRSVLTYGLTAGSMLRAENLRVEGRGTSFQVLERGRRVGSVTLRIPGVHNVKNALAAAAVGLHFGAPWDAIAEGLARYQGVDRRFEQVGEAEGVIVIDDYAHHPTEIEATLGAARASFPQHRIIAVFQPHLYSRTRDFAREFGRALAAADLVFVTDIYAAREAPIDGVTGELVAASARAVGAEVEYLPDRGEVVQRVGGALRPGDVCITLGAGDLNVAAREILNTIQSHDQT